MIDNSNEVQEEKMVMMMVMMMMIHGKTTVQGTTELSGQVRLMLRSGRGLGWGGWWMVCWHSLGLQIAAWRCRLYWLLASS